MRLEAVVVLTPLLEMLTELLVEALRWAFRRARGCRGDREHAEDRQGEGGGGGGG